MWIVIAFGILGTVMVYSNNLTANYRRKFLYEIRDKNEDVYKKIANGSSDNILDRTYVKPKDFVIGSKVDSLIFSKSGTDYVSSKDIENYRTIRLIFRCSLFIFLSTILFFIGVLFYALIGINN